MLLLIYASIYIYISVHMYTRTHITDDAAILSRIPINLNAFMAFTAEQIHFENDLCIYIFVFFFLTLASGSDHFICYIFRVCPCKGKPNC